MSNIISEIIEAIKTADYTVAGSFIVLLSFVFLFRSFQKVLIANKDNKRKINTDYKQLLINLLKDTGSNANVVNYTELLKYTKDIGSYKRLEHYIKTKNKEKLINYVHIQLQQIQSEDFLQFDGPDSLFRLIAYSVKRLRIDDYLLLPFLLSSLILYIVMIVLFLMVQLIDKIYFFVVLISICIIIISALASYSVILTERFAFESRTIKLFYILSLIIIVLLDFLPSVFGAIVSSFILYSTLIMLLHESRKNTIIDVSVLIEKSSNRKGKKIYDFAAKNNMKLISDEKNIITYAYFSPFSLLAVYQFQKEEKTYKLVRKIVDITFENFTDKEKKNIQCIFNHKNISIDLNDLERNDTDNS